MFSEQSPGRRLSKLVCAGFLLAAAGSVVSVPAAEHAAELLPATTVGYLEISRPGELLHEVLDHPVSQQIQKMDVFREATKSEQYRSFLTGRKFFELQIGKEWRPAVESLTSGGIVLGFDAKTEGTVLLIRGQDESTMEHFRAKILELTRLAGGDAQEPETYREIPVYKVEKNAAAVVKDWLIVTNKRELGRIVVDRLLDPNAADETLASRDQFQQALKARSASAHAWGFGDVEAVRASGAARKVFEDKAENPLAELLIGGIQNTLQHTPFVTFSLTAAETGLRAELQAPWNAAWVPEERAYYFGTPERGVAPALPEVPETLVTLSTWRDVSQMWLRAGDLFNEQMNDQLAAAESTLTTIFAGHDFGEEILGSLAPEMGLVVVRQNFEGIRPVPAIKLPAFALVLKLKDAETMRPELRRTFQSTIGFFNIVGAQEGRPQLEMDMVRNGDQDLITSRYVPEKKDRDSTTAEIIYNFSPSAGFSGDRFVLSSTAALAEQLISAAPARSEQESLNTSLTFHAEAISRALNDNRDQLISQNMLEEGHSREEAEAAIGLLFEALRFVNGAGLKLRHEDESLSLELSLDVNSAPAL